jgi:subtilisin family serine protease
MSYVEQRPGGYDPLIFAASGNASDHPNYAVDKESPAAAAGVFSVGAIDEQGKIAPFSNINPVFVGPGVEVVSAKSGGGLKVLSGTSMACPHLAGLAALYFSALRTSGQRATSRRVERALRNSAADRFVAGQSFTHLGDGMPRVPGA